MELEPREGGGGSGPQKKPTIVLDRVGLFDDSCGTQKLIPPELNLPSVPEPPQEPK